MGLSRKDAERLGILGQVGHLFPKRGEGARIAAGLIPRPADRTPYPGYPGRWTIDVPGWRPTLDNELKRSPYAAHRLKAKDARVIGNAAMICRVPQAIGRRRMSLTIFQRFGRPPDDPAPYKSLNDALKTNGLIVDDSREWLEIVWPPSYPRGERRTVIVLEDIENEKKT